MFKYTIRGDSSGGGDVVQVLGEHLRAEHEPQWGSKDPTIVAFSDGTVLSARYDGPSGVWRITLVSKGTGHLSLDLAAVDDEEEYSDIATLRCEDPIAWVVFGVAYELSRCG